MKYFPTTFVFLLSVLPNFTQAKEPPAEAMNLIVIMTDEHNFRTLGCYRKTLSERQALMWGEAVVETPHIDSLARDGALCTSFYATTPVCSPSRGCLITGLYPQATPVTTNNIPLADDMVTFAELLKRRGYATGFAGKWHLDGDGKPQWAPKRKFGFEDNRYMFNRGHWKKLEITEQGPRVAARNNRGVPSYAVDDADKETFTTDFLTNRTLEFIETNKTKPFSYMVSYPDPHGPDTVRAPYDTMFNDQEYKKPTTHNVDPKTAPNWGKPQNGNYQQSSYYGMVKCLDDNVGRILAKLKADDLLDKTIIVFTSDHGDLRGEHHRQNKGVPYEASTRVAFLVRFPGKIKPGTIINEALTSVDFVPTFLPMMGVEDVGKVHGRNAAELFTTGKAPKDWHDIAFVRGTGTVNGWLMAVTDRYKLVYSASDSPWLFDLERDPDEVVNMFTNDAYREIVQKMATSLRKYAADHNDPFVKGQRISADMEWSINGKGPYEGK